MAKQNRRAVQDRRDAKKEGRTRQEVQPQKFQGERKASVIPLTAKNENQKKALQLMATKQCTVLLGSAGSGKSELMGWHASKRWLEGDVENIMITRPNKVLGNEAGHIPGNDFMKMLPFCMSVLLKLKKYLGAGILKNNLRTEDVDVLFNEQAGIQIVSLEKLQGISVSPTSILIAEEIQNATVAQVKSLLTRMEEGAQIIITGDVTQSALTGENGLSYLLRKIKTHPHDEVGFVEFTPEDCCRLGVSAHFTKVFEQDGQW